MKSLFLTLLLATLPLGAIDISGKWTGSFEGQNNEGEKKTEPAFLIFKQEGGTLTGSGGPNEGEQHPFQNGKVEGDKVSFEISLNNGGTIYFNLTVTGDEIKGDMKRTRGDREQTAKLSLKRLAEK
jgi:hypothetical protein